jgi:hypothetical protein
MESTSRFRLVLVHAIAVVWFAAELTYQAGFAFGTALHRRHGALAAKASAQPAEPDPQRQAVIEGWEAAVAAGLWEEPEPVEPLCPGAWWDLIDPGEHSESDPELPLRWAV